MIDKTAIIDPKAKIDLNVKIGPFCVIGANVEIKKNTIIQSHVSILGNTKIGEKNTIYPFASIGNDPQDLKFKGEKTNLVIGNNNKIREYVTINPGTKGGGGLTKIGSNCLFMVSSHIAHDCLVEDNVILANNVPLGGHAHIEENVIIGGNSAVQQFTRIGKSAMIGGMCGVVRDVIPYGIAHGNRSVLQGLNLIGLRRKNIPNKVIIQLSEAYKEIFKNENLTENLKNLNKELSSNELVKDVVNFLEKDKKRPICTPFSK
jgi:UDP-N-acetylglucosamine acyltransferase